MANVLQFWKWFCGLYLIETCGERGITTDAFATLLDISYNAAWRMKRKLVRLVNDRDRPLRLDLMDST